jgi:hypothetical protein
MANKKKKAGSHRSRLKQQKLVDAQFVNDSAVLALTTPPSTVHATVTPNSNSKQSPLVDFVTTGSRPLHHVLSSPHGSVSHYRGDPSPSINHVFVEDWSGEDDLEDEEVDFDSSVDFYYVGASTFSSSPVVVASPASCQSTPPPLPLAEKIPSPPVASPADGQSTLPSLPLAEKILSPPLEKTVLPSSPSSGCREVPPSTVAGNPVSVPGSSKWSDLFLSNRSSISYTKLQHFSLNHLSRTCGISPEDIQPEFDVWKFCAVGYVSGKRPGYRVLNSIISTVWKCEATLSIHDSGWLVYRFKTEEAKLSVLSGGPYLIYGRPLILRPMMKFFDFSSEEMSRVPVWVKFPNLPLCCWSPICLSKIATSTLSRISYARVLVEIDLLEDLRHSVEISLPEGPALRQPVVYEALPKYCTFCHVLGHTRLLCPKAAASQAIPRNQPLTQATQAAKGNVFSRLGPQPPLQPSPPLP